MRFIAVIAGLVLLSTTISSLETGAKSTKAKKCTKKGYWGDNCSKLCGKCLGGKPCNPVSGKCDKSGGKCEEGWQSKNAGQQKCDEPMCFGTLGCDHEGECIAPNYCKCSGGGAMGQVVGVAGTYANDKGEEVEGIQCISLRLDGLKGFFIALAVLIVSISTCGFVANKKLLADKM